MPSLSLKPRPSQTSVQLSPPAQNALNRIKKIHGVSKKRAIERGVILLETLLSKNPATASGFE